MDGQQYNYLKEFFKIFTRYGWHVEFEFVDGILLSITRARYHKVGTDTMVHRIPIWRKK